MRPRVIPAEDNRRYFRLKIGAHAGFNEAAGNPRGRRTSSPSSGPAHCCFNEAAGNPRGRPPAGARAAPGTRGFNEAAGNPRGRPEDTDVDSAAVRLVELQ